MVGGEFPFILSFQEYLYKDMYLSQGVYGVPLCCLHSHLKHFGGKQQISPLPGSVALPTPPGATHGILLMSILAAPGCETTTEVLLIHGLLSGKVSLDFSP